MLNLLVNPIAGGKKGKRMLKNLAIIEKRLKEKNAQYIIYRTDKPGDATIITRRLIEESVDNIIVVGGDGTLHEVINGFSHFDRVVLGVIPCGTGNDFAAALKVPEDAEKAVDIVLSGQTEYVDYMQMPTVRGLNIIGMGVDVEVLKLYAESKTKTKLTYTKCLLKALAKFKCVEFDASLDGGEMKTYSSFIACVANGHRYGGGISICPIANVTDNNLDFVAVKEMGKLKVARAVIKLKKGKILTIPQASHTTMKSVKVVPKTEKYTVNVDGELYDSIPFEVQIVSNQLQVFKK